MSTEHLKVIADATTASAAADEAYAKAKAEYEETEKSYRALKGIAPEAASTLMDLVKRYGPKAATYFGLPGAAAALTAAGAEPGSFAKITGLLGNILRAFGL